MRPIRFPTSRLSTESAPGLIRKVHLDVLEVFGKRIGFGFHEQAPLEPPCNDLIIVFGRFNPRAPQREFGLQLFTEKLDDGRVGRVAWLIDLYLPERCRRQGAGTVLIDALLHLWEQIGVVEVRATTVGDGQPAFSSWGFAADPRHPPDHGLLPLRLRLPRVPNPAD